MGDQSHNSDGSEALTPEDVRAQSRALLATDGTIEAGDDVETPWTALLTPAARAKIIGALVEAGGEPLSAARLAEMADVSQPTFNRNQGPLQDLGVLREVDKVGNARRYALATDHPVAQALVMLDNVLTWGETPQLLEERFVGEPGNE